MTKKFRESEIEIYDLERMTQKDINKAIENRESQGWALVQNIVLPETEELPQRLAVTYHNFDAS